MACQTCGALFGTLSWAEHKCARCDGSFCKRCMGVVGDVGVCKNCMEAVDAVRVFHAGSGTDTKVCENLGRVSSQAFGKSDDAVLELRAKTAKMGGNAVIRVSIRSVFGWKYEADGDAVKLAKR